MSPFAVAIRGLLISTIQGPGEVETGGVRVIVPLSIVVTVSSGRNEIEFRAALALLMRPTSTEETRTPIRMSATTLVFIRLLSIFLARAEGCDTRNYQSISCER